MKKIFKYLIFIYYVPKLNILYRIFFIFKRRFMSVIKKNIDSNYLFFSSGLSIRESVPKGNVIPINIKKSQLPIFVNLVGYSMKIDKNIEWYPRNLDYGTRLERLNLHYMDYLNQLEFKDSIYLIEKWIKDVTPYGKNYWRDSWNCYALSIRIINWIDIISENSFFLKSINKETLDLINKSIEYQVDFLLNNLELDVRGNHLIKNIRCIFRACSYLRGFKVKRWFESINSYILEELEKQFLSDGMHYELSPSYHNLVAEDLICIRRSLNSFYLDFNLSLTQEIKVKLDEVIRKVYFVILRLTHPDGSPSLFSDGGLNACKSPSMITKEIEKTININNDLSLSNKKIWGLESSGFYGITSDHNCFITKCGDFGADSLPAHGQSDSLSFEWSVEGSRIIIDQGVFTYHPGFERDFSRSTKAHNTLTLNNLDQSDCWSSFKVGRRARTKVTKFEKFEDGFYLRAFHNGYEHLKGKPLVFREMLIKPNKILFNDYVNDNFEHEVKSRILLSPNINLTKINNINSNKYECLLKLVKGNDNHEELSFILKSDCNFLISNTFWYPNFGVKVATKRIEFDLGVSPCKSSWSIVRI